MLFRGKRFFFIIKIIFLMLILFNIKNYLIAHDSKGHSRDLCRVLFGFEYVNNKVFEKDDDTFKNDTNDFTNKAFKLMRYAIAVAIDNTGDETEEYKELKDLLQGSSVRMPRISEKAEENELLITNMYHRQVCHQGFDYVYSNPKSNKRWNDVGRKLLINVAREAFAYKSRKPDDATATFIAMIAYYTHILGDLGEGETKWMKNSVGTFYKFLNELILKIDSYGKGLKDSSCINELLTKLRSSQPIKSTIRADKEVKRVAYSEQILEIVSEYIPKIISNNVDSNFKFNTNKTSLQNVA